MAVITREGLAAPKGATLDVTVEELGGEVRLRAMSAGEALDVRARSNKLLDDEPALAGLLARQIARSWVDEAGVPLWANGREDEGVQFVLALPLDAYQKLSAALLKLNGVNAEEIEAAAKN